MPIQSTSEGKVSLAKGIIFTKIGLANGYIFKLYHTPRNAVLLYALVIAIIKLYSAIHLRDSYSYTQQPHNEGHNTGEFFIAPFLSLLIRGFIC